MSAEIFSAFTAIKAASELVGLILKRKVDAAIQEKAIELQSAIVSAQSDLLNLQSAYQERLREIEDLRKQLIDMQDWKAEAQKYELRVVGPGIFVYAIRDDQVGTGPMHWLCTQCYNEGKKSILQRGRMGVNGWSYLCPGCKVKIEAPNIVAEANDSDKKEDQDEIDEIERIILVSLARMQAMTIPQLVDCLEVDLTILQYHVQKLYDQNYVQYGSNRIGEPASYRLSQSGRHYLITKKLISVDKPPES